MTKQSESERSFKPLLTTTDWNEEWKALQISRKAADSREYWNERSKTFGHKKREAAAGVAGSREAAAKIAGSSSSAKSRERRNTSGGYVSYSESFLKALRIDAGDSVFDMGCGNGALAIPLARAGHKVFAADFSTGMLDELAKAAREADEEVAGCDKATTSANANGAPDTKTSANPAANSPHTTRVSDNITTALLSWDDPWSAWCAVGACENSADIAIASRSIATQDLKDSLMKLERVARKRCCITLSTGASPRIDEQISEALGLQAQMGRDFLYAFNILAASGRKPSVIYLDNFRHDKYETRDEALESLARMLEDIKRKVPEPEHKTLDMRFNNWVEENLCERTDPESNEKFWQLKHPRKTQWAFISWEVL